MTTTGKKARRTYGTRFAAKKAKGSKGKHFAPTPTDRMTDPALIHRRAMATARSMGLISHEE